MAAEKPAEAAPKPTIPFDYLAVAEELHSGRIRVSDGAAEAGYREAGEADLNTMLDGVDVAPSPIVAEEEPEEVLSIEPDAIAAELGLADAGPTDLGRLRRAFALKNHPDRVPPGLRQRALKRMQVANSLIDEARRRALAKTRR